MNHNIQNCTIGRYVQDDMELFVKIIFEGHTLDDQLLMIIYIYVCVCVCSHLI